MYLVTFSPYAKIFQKDFLIYEKDKKGSLTVTGGLTTHDLLADPERIKREEIFSVRIENPRGDVVFKSGEPLLITEFTFPNHDASSAPLLRLWLTGGPTGTESPLTDFAGIVQIPYTPEELGALSYFANAGLPLTPELEKRRLQALSDAKRLSNERVLRHVQKTFANAKRQVELNEQNGKGQPDISTVEILCAHILKDEDAKRAKDHKEAAAVFNNLSKNR